jgi:hypothetical protein
MDKANEPVQASYERMRDALVAATTAAAGSGSSSSSSKRPILYSLCSWGTGQPWLWGKTVCACVHACILLSLPLTHMHMHTYSHIYTHNVPCHPLLQVGSPWQVVGIDTITLLLFLTLVYSLTHAAGWQLVWCGH